MDSNGLRRLSRILQSDGRVRRTELFHGRISRGANYAPMSEIYWHDVVMSGLWLFDAVCYAPVNLRGVSDYPLPRLVSRVDRGLTKSSCKGSRMGLYVTECPETIL